MRKMRVATIWTIALVLLAFVASSAMAADKKVIELKFGCGATDTDPMMQGVWKFAELVKARTNGEVVVNIYCNMVLGTLVQQVEALKMGAQDFFMDQITWYQELDGMNALRYFALPSGFKDHAQAKKFMKSKMGQDLLETLRAKHGVRMLAFNWNRPPRQVLSKRPFTDLQGLKGLKIRVPEQELWVGAWKAQGANPTPIAWAELYTALQQGIVEALEAPAALIYSTKFQEQGKNLIYTNHSAALVTLSMNEKKFQTLTPAQQKILYACAEEAGEVNNSAYDTAEKSVADQFRKDGVTVLQLKDRDAFWKPQDDFILAMEAKGQWPKGMKQLVDSLK
jgi:TRAP-type transport system periplasmic protein